MADPLIPDPLYDPRSYIAYYLQQAGRTPSPQMQEALKPVPPARPWMRDHLNPEIADFLGQALQYGPMALPAGARPPGMRGPLTFQGRTYPTMDAMVRAMEDAGVIPRAPVGPSPEQGPWNRNWDHRAWQDRHPSPYEELARHQRIPRLTEHEVRRALGGAFERE